MDFEKLLAMGQAMNLQGTDLWAFVKDREAKAEKDKERDERQKEHEHQKELKELELEIEEKRAQRQLEQTTHGDSSLSSAYKQIRPKLPHFNDGKDDMDAYLRRFERFAQIAGWDQSEWAGMISTLLTGRALEVYSRLPLEQATSYEKLKEALLHKYQLTAEGFRVKFRSSKREKGETYSQYIDRLKQYLLRWVQLSKTKEEFKDVVDLFLREQVIVSSSKDLAIFLKEREPKDSTEMAAMADRYIEAHEKERFSNRDRQHYVERPKGSYGSSGPRQTESTEQSKGGVKPQGKDSRGCYVCGKRGHIARDCWNKFKVNEKEKGRPTGMCEVSEQNEETDQQGSEQVTAACVNAKSVDCDCRMKIGSGQNVKLECGHELPVVSAVCTRGTGMPICKGFVGTKEVTVMRDTGCSVIVVKRNLVEDDQLLGKTQKCVLIDGTVRIFPVAWVTIDTPYLVGTVEAVCMPEPLYDLVLGNVNGVREPGGPNRNWVPANTIDKRPDGLNKNEDGQKKKLVDKKEKGSELHEVTAVETRAQKIAKKKSLRPLTLSAAPIPNITTVEMKNAQREDETLKNWWKSAHAGVVQTTRKQNEIKFVMGNGILYREFRSSNVSAGKMFRQMAVPKKFRVMVLNIAHDSAMAGHLRVKKTLNRVIANFYWPGVQGDVQRYCASCDICQRTVSKGTVPVVPLGSMPLIDTPFKRVAIDLVGPLDPVTDRGNRYILTLVDFETRYPEAVVLLRIETERVAEALLEIFSCMGVPSEILSDLGTQFTSDLMREVGRLLSVTQLHTTPYHPICNGLVEKFNGTLKQMLRRMCHERPRDWNRYLPALLFAYREVPQESTGHSPFQLMFGRSVRGPLSILRELWTGEGIEEEVRSTYQYVIDLRDRLEATCKLAQEELKKAVRRYKKYYDTRARERKFKRDDKVLLLLPTDANKLKMQWRGPYTIVERVGQNDYKVNVNGSYKMYHANLLKKYVERVEDTEKESKTKESSHETHAVGAMHGNNSVIEEDDDLGEVNLLPIEREESHENVEVCPNRSSEEKAQLRNTLEEFSDVLSD
ncbi:hypothetical protein HOLleu_27522 [Holothuria leucospilota]|uniref:Uncharacterized protein n=1 Tax=Holothuria leucospilota TaxID=206669 RepID=A0A9Q1H2E0_HOLLE|nr:hypothetical protein HOLleu_27522 [Holothuria leucospilota]